MVTVQCGEGVLVVREDHGLPIHRQYVDDVAVVRCESVRRCCAAIVRFRAFVADAAPIPGRCGDQIGPSLLEGGFNVTVFLYILEGV